MSLQNFLNPLAGFWQRIMPAFSQLTFDRVQRCSHALLYRLTPDHKCSVFPGLRAEMRKAQKVESLRLSLAQPLPVAYRMPSKTDQLCFAGV